MDKPAGVGASYLRVSDADKQDKRSQEQAIQRWLDECELTIVKTYSDAGSRDLAYKRPQFQQLLRDLASGSFSWVVIAETDRLGARDAYELSHFMHLFREAGVELWSVNDGLLNGDGPVAPILTSITGERSKDEQKARGQRAVRAKIECAQRGEWTGGSPPYGHDLAAVDESSRELWRVYYLSRYERVQIFPDGRRVQWNGVAKFPARDPDVVLKVVPSCDTERVEMARTIFRWFATESLSLRKLCTRLNDMGVSPVCGPGWYTSKLKPMLMNPVYLTGVPAWNKKAHGRFTEFVGGKQRPVERTKGRVLTGRKRATTDYVSAEGTGGIIPEAIFQKVQEKLAGIHKTIRAPRSSDHILSGLLVCGHCQRFMCAWALNADRYQKRSYACSTYRQYGYGNAANRTCYLHRTHADLLERLVDEYLAECDATLNCLLDVDEEDDLAAYLTAEADPRVLKYVKRITAIWREVKAGRFPERDHGDARIGTAVCMAYLEMKEATQAHVRAELEEKQAQMGVLAGQLSRQKTPAAIAAISQAMDELGVAIAGLQERLQPLDELLAASAAELAEVADQIARARQALKGDQHRQRAQALQDILARIVCYYRHHMAGRQRRSKLCEVRFEPLLGEAKTVKVGTDLRDGSWSSPASISQMLARVYSMEEIAEVLG